MSGWPNQSAAFVWGFDSRFAPVNVMTCGAKGDAVSDDTAAIQLAVNKAVAAQGGTVYFPPGRPGYRISAPIDLPVRNIALVGAANHRCTLLPTDDFVGNELVRIRASDCYVVRMGFRPRTGIAGIRVKGAALAHIFDSLFLATADTIGQGTGIVLDDRDDAGVFRPGSYYHRIERCQFSIANLPLQNAIVTDAQSEINQCVIYANRIIGDAPIVWNHGGGNWFAGNLIQSLTGTSGSQVGTGITCLLGQVVTGNFIENYVWSISNVAGHQGLADNWYDNVLNPVGSSIPRLNLVNADATLVQITNEVHRLNGNGGNRTACGISVGARNGQRLTLIGFSWGVQIVSGGAGGATIIFNAGASTTPNFSNASGGTQTLQLIWDAASTAWREQSRTTVA